MHYGKKHLKEVAKEYLEPNSEGDHKPAKSDVIKTNFINAKMKKLNQKAKNEKAVKNLNKVLSDIKGIPRKSALNMLGVSSPLNKVKDHTNTSCWSSKVQVGTKMSSTNPGVRVNDCVDPSSPRAKNK